MTQLHIVAPTTDERAISHLFKNLDLILSNKRYILSHSKYRNIRVPGLFVGGLYIGIHEMSLGDILKLWDKTEWYTEPRYYYSIIGTPLSGMNESRWYDFEKKKFESGTYFNGKEHFLGLAKPALDYLKLHHKYTKSELSIFDLVELLQQ